MIRGTHLYYFAKDNLGSVKAVIDASSGAIAQAIHDDEFGRVLINTNPGFQPFGFAGGHFDHETGLVRFGARDYDPEVGRWTARDPILFDGGQGNLYSYVENDSINRVDPSGLWALQIGFSLSGFVLTGGASFSVGVAISGTGFSINEVNSFQSSQWNGGLGASFGRGFQVSFTPNARCLGDLTGTSVGFGVDSPIGGFTVSGSQAGPTFSLSGPSLGASIFGFSNMTNIGAPIRQTGN